MLAAAREVFAEKGYAGATTREIAERASVREGHLFQQFETKQALFEAAILLPFQEFVRRYADDWADRFTDTSAPEQMLTSYVRELYSVVREQRDLLLALPIDGILDEVNATRALLDRLADLAADVAALHDFAIDPQIVVRLVFVQVTTTALFADQLLPGRDQEDIVAELTAMIVAGITQRRARP
jgi:AcrR family transcriptional regulator